MRQKQLIALFGLFLFSGILQGQDPVFKASAPAQVQTGEQFQYVVEGPERGDVILPESTGLLRLGGPFSSYSSSQQWINGKMTRNVVASYTYVYRIDREGDFTIPPAKIKVSRKEYETNAVSIRVRSASQGTPATAESGAEAQSTGEPDEVFLRILPGKKEMYVGEQFVSGLKVYTRVNTRPAGNSGDIPYEGFYKTTIDADAGAGQTEISGIQYVSQVLQRHILIPQKSGELIIPPYTSEWMKPQRVQPQQRRSIFDDPFFSSVREVPVELATLPVRLKIKPLPPGAPEGFSGAVGSFSIDASLSTYELEENEALSLLVHIKGNGNLPLFGEPRVNLPPDHDLYDVNRKLSIATSGNRLSGKVSFEYPIVVRHAGSFRIPPVKFSWFDPITEKYHTAATEEFTFKVTKGNQPEISTGAYVPGIMQEDVRDLGTDIRDISRQSQEFFVLNATLMGKNIYPWIFLLFLLLALAIGLLINLVAKRNADLSLVQNRRAAKEARSRLKRADKCRKNKDEEGFYEEIGKAVWGYLSHKMNIDTSALSGEVVMEKLVEEGLDSEILDHLQAILEESEFSRFAPASEKKEMDRLYEDAVKLISNLENRMK